MNEAKRKKLERTRASVRALPYDISIPSKPFATIGIYLQRKETGDPFCASDRIRGEWIAKCSDKIELFNESKNYEVVIFHVACKAIAEYGRIKILDICDRVWEKDTKEFLQLIDPIDGIIVPTEGLKQQLAQITDKKIFVIGDGHDPEHYSTAEKNLHVNRAKEVVWFGYAENAHCLQPYINYIKSCGIKLKVISQRSGVSPMEHADVFVKWDIKTYVKEISKADFAILPRNQEYKSNNKDVTAMYCGIPVAKNKSDISTFMLAHERRKFMDMAKKDLLQYSVVNRMQDYLEMIDEIKKDNIIQVYSAISGKIDKPRKDIYVFTENSTDKFRQPVMNAKIYKVLSHKYFDSSFSIYMDGNIFLTSNANHLIETMLKDADMALFKHPWRDCLYKEHEHAIARVPAEFKHLMNDQVHAYRKEGMPEAFGLAECGMLIRRNNEATAEFNERWWAEICRYTNRDQMSFPYVMWKMGNKIKVNFIEGNVRQHTSFKYVNH